MSVRIAFVGDNSGELVCDAQPPLCLREQHHPAVRGDPPAIESSADLLPATAGRSKGKGVLSIMASSSRLSRCAASAGGIPAAG